MGGKYYCEYCDRSFRDTAEDRKKHRHTGAHQTAKLEHDIVLLRDLCNKLGHRLPFIFTPEEHRIFSEVLTKPNACKFHNLSNLNNQHLHQQSQCKYGDRCNNSHLLSQSQIIHYKDKFLSQLSCEWSSVQPVPGSILSAHPQPSKRQAKKEIYLNLWLEKQFGMEKRSTEQIRQLLSQEPNGLHQQC